MRLGYYSVRRIPPLSRMRTRTRLIWWRGAVGVRWAAREDGGPEQANQTRCSQEKGTLMCFNVVFHYLCSKRQLLIVIESILSVCVPSVMLTFHVNRPLLRPASGSQALSGGRGCQESSGIPLRLSLDINSLEFISHTRF